MSEQTENTFLKKLLNQKETKVNRILEKVKHEKLAETYGIRLSEKEN